MCGILGILRADGSKPVSVELATNALIECSTRGTDATGLWSPSIGTVKDNDEAEKFARNNKEAIELALQDDITLFHTRATTVGRGNSLAPAHVNENNHPHEGERFVLIHNGHFGNLPEVKNYPYKGKCDSEIFLSYLETFGVEKTIEMQHKDDKFAVAIYDKKIDVLYLFRHTNPIIYVYDKLKKIFVFASTTDILLELFERNNEFGLYGFDAPVPIGMREDTLVALNREGATVYDKIKSFRSTLSALVDMDKDDLTKAGEELDKIIAHQTKHSKHQRWIPVKKEEEEKEPRNLIHQSRRLCLTTVSGMNIYNHHMIIARGR